MISNETRKVREMHLLIVKGPNQATQKRLTFDTFENRGLKYVLLQPLTTRFKNVYVQTTGLKKGMSGKFVWRKAEMKKGKGSIKKDRANGQKKQ